MNWLASISPTGQFLLFSLLKAVGAVAVVLAIVAYAVYVERKVCAAVQDRIGPNRVGPYGLLQPLADAVKAFFKEDLAPRHVRKVYFWLAPAIVMLPGLLALAVIPFGSRLGQQKMVIADLNVGVLYTFGIVSLGVYGIVLAGYAANSKYPFIGGVRAGAQMVSYEVAMGLSVVPLFLIVGDLNLSQLINYQAGHVWLVAQAPLSFVIFLVAAFAETNRLPFDLPEAEQELAGGYNVEYSSIKFALFFLGEYASMVASAAMMVTLFFGGWTLPFWGLDQPASNLCRGLVHVGVFLLKMLALVLLFIWVRWMWPRFRHDQLMALGWKRLVPLALANIVATAAVLWIRS